MQLPLYLDVHISYAICSGFKKTPQAKLHRWRLLKPVFCICFNTRSLLILNMPIAKPLNPNRTPETRQKMKSSRAVFMNHDPTCCKTTCNQVTSWATAQRDSHWPICHKRHSPNAASWKASKSLIKSHEISFNLPKIAYVISIHIIIIGQKRGSFPSLSSSFPALQVHPPWVRCLESNPKMPSKGWSRYGYMALQGDWLAIIQPRRS